MSLSAIEHSLTVHIRSSLSSYPKETLKKLAFAISLISCLCAGSVLLFSLFTPVLQHDLSYTQFQINVIGGCTAMGMYLPLPYLGYLADAHGPVILAVLASVLFAPSYIAASIIVQNNLAFWLLGINFAFIGCATSAIYFTSLLTCTKIFPGSKGLVISAPVTCYGLSSLIGSQVLKLRFLRKSEENNTDELDLFKTFRFFAILYLILGLFNWVSSSIVSIERDILFTNPDTNEESPLLENGDSDSDADLVPNHEARYLQFLKDKSAYVLLLSLLTSLGPSEMFITNLGSLVKVISPNSSIESQVSTHAIFSTIARLSLAPLSDLLLSIFNISRIWLLTLIIIIGAITQAIIASPILTSSSSGESFYIISALSGFTYGGYFTLYPTIVLSIWGSELFGSTWGSFMVAPALGSTGFGLLYAFIYDSKCSVGVGLEQTLSGSCVSAVYWTTTLSFFFSALLLLFAWRLIWVQRGVAI